MLSKRAAPALATLSPALVVLGLLALSACTPNASSPLIVESGVCADTSNLFPFAAPAPVAENRVNATLYVDGASPGAADTNPGTVSQPFRTVSAAAARAVKNNLSNIGTRVLIAPAIYREQISLAMSQGVTPSLIVFEATVKGQAVISGADVWREWRPEAQANTYSSVWPYKWGLAPYPKDWEGNVVLEPITRRREMLFVNDVPYTQVLSKAALVANSFYVAEDEALIYIRTSPGFDLKPATVEVSVRPILFHAQGKTNLVLRGLSFVRGNRPVPDSSVEILDSQNVQVEDCEFRWNNWDAFQVSTSTNVTVVRSVANNNGAAGFGAYQLKEAVYSDNETSYNNWRGAQGGFYGWAVAGSKFGNLHGAVIRNHHSEHNQTRGFWLDYDNARVLVENVNWSNNFGDGVFIEANQGPILIRNSTFSNNKNGSGISGASSSDITLAQNIISGNELAQIQITGDFDRQVTNWETNVTYTLRAERWMLTCNAIANTDKAQALIETPNWAHFLNSVQSQKDVWFTATNPFPFRIGNAKFSYSDWKGVTK
ncbi:MAG: right-handed parallel beta-helix repeat-containing protein [Acidobacteriota bacterium]|nr:right-handed parallel beta-helix repeat-containing protein [Acidobacteriota bacterium]